MKRLEKIVIGFLRNPSEADFPDVEFLLEAFEFSLDRQESSHVTFKNFPGRSPPIFTVPLIRGRKVKRHYIRDIVNMLDLEVWYEKNKS